jgi:CheY-like chemotaxis protein
MVGTLAFAMHPVLVLRMTNFDSRHCNAILSSYTPGKLVVRATWTNMDRITENRSNRNDSTVDNFVLARGDNVSYERAGTFKLTVTDSGAGMTQDQLSRLFLDGVQFNVNELQGGNGTGLGLHITKGIIEQHMGRIEASSDGLDLGTTFTVSLPMYYVPDRFVSGKIGCDVINSPRNKINKQLSTSKLVEISSLRILVVDDAATNRKLLQRLLQNHGHKCDEASDGEVALRLVQDGLKTSKLCYDTILMDHEMPVMDGPTSVKRMRDLGCQSFIVGITGNVLPEDIAIFKRSGADNVLPKPFHLNDLLNLWVENGLFQKQTTMSTSDSVHF